MTSRGLWDTAMGSKEAAETIAQRDLPIDGRDRIASGGRRSKVPTSMRTLMAVMEAAVAQDHF